MKNLKLLGISVTLLCVLSMTAFGDDTNSSCAPGATNSPPCAAAQITLDDSTAPEQAVSASVSGYESDFSVRDVMIDLLQAALTLV